MLSFLVILQVCIIALLVFIVLFQKSSTDSLAGLSGGGHNVISGKASTNIMTKMTWFLAVAFMVNSLVLAKFTITNFQSSGDLIKSISAPELNDILERQSTEPAVPAVPKAE
jgi:preprotein translocase subunit SecG